MARFNKIFLLISLNILNLIFSKKENQVNHKKNKVNSNNYLISKECSINKENTLLECSLSRNKNQNLNSKNFEGKKINFNEEKFIENLKVEIRNLEGDVTHLKIFDQEKPRYEIPRNTIEYFELGKKFLEFSNKKNLKNLPEIKSGNPFELNYLSDDGNENLFSIFSNFFFMDDFISFNYNLQSNQIFGYGERSSDFKLKPGLYTTWPRDMANTFDDGKGSRNSYGHQPFFLHRRNSKNFIAFAFLNSNAQDLIVKEPLDGNTEINQITIGGIVELLIINGNSAENVLRKYHNIIGRPVLPNFWALGWHQSRWGYKNTTNLKSIVSKYNEHKIPIDTIWSDIDYLKNLTDFDYDHYNYEKLPEFIEEVKSQKMHYVPIIDMGIPNKTDDKYFKLGKDLDVYIKSNYTKDYLYNIVWPGICVYPDFTNYEKAKKFWLTGLSDLKKDLNFDGIWLDMNEPSGFMDSEIPNENLDQSRNKYSNLTYLIGNKRENYTIDSHSISSNALMNPDLEPFNTVFNLKPVNAFYENKITHEFFSENLNQRPFVLSRSSFIGMNRYTSHWLGDNWSDFKNMTRSIAGIFNFQMFGFNLVGADICGLLDNTNDELCSRWTALGSFYPFSRNHNNKSSIDQEPFNLGEKTLNSAKQNIRIRYSLLRYFYTQMYINSLEGGVFFKPMAFEFPEVEDFVEIDEILNQQIMLGKSILFNPILNEKEDNVTFAFPNSKWNKFPNGEIFMQKNENDILRENSYQNKTLTGKFSDLHLFVKGGSIIPYYNILGNQEILRSNDLENMELSLIINPDENGLAEGDLIYDDTNSEPSKTIKNGLYCRERIYFDSKTQEIKFDLINSFDYNKKDRYISEIIIYGGNNKNENSFNNLRFLESNDNNKNGNIEYLRNSEGNLHLKMKRPVNLNKERKIEF